MGRTILCSLSLLLPLVLAVPLPSSAQEASDAKAIVRRADEVRFPQAGFEVEVMIKTIDSGQDEEVRKYKVLSRGGADTLVLATEPAAERGQIMLMKDRDLWLFVPSVSQPIRLSLAQRLTGQVANGDIARANFAGDYQAVVLGMEQADGHPVYKLELTALDRGVTYQKVHYWVRKGDFFPQKAEFYSASGRLIKTCSYEEYRKLDGQVRPTRLVLRDALKVGEVSVLEYSNLRARNLPDKVFTKDYLKKLQ